MKTRVMVKTAGGVFAANVTYRILNSKIILDRVDSVDRGFDMLPFFTESHREELIYRLYKIGEVKVVLIA